MAPWGPPNLGLDPVIPLLSLLTTCSQEPVSLPSLVMPQGPQEVCSQILPPSGWAPGPSAPPGSPQLYSQDQPPNQAQGIELIPSPRPLCLQQNRFLQSRPDSQGLRWQQLQAASSGQPTGVLLPPALLWALIDSLFPPSTWCHSLLIYICWLLHSPFLPHQKASSRGHCPSLSGAP